MTTEIAKATLEQLEATIESGMKSFLDVGNALIEIRERKLYRETHKTFEAYCHERWKFTPHRARQLMSATETVSKMVTIVTKNTPDCQAVSPDYHVAETVVPPTNEAQARELSKVAPEKRAEVWQEATKTAPDGKVTAKHIRETAESLEAGDGAGTNSTGTESLQEPSTEPPGNGAQREAAPVELGQCPACAGAKWEHDEFGWICSKCGHPHGEPAGDADEERITTQRSKTVKTVEALMREFDSLQLLRPRNDHGHTMSVCKQLLTTARNWK